MRRFVYFVTGILTFVAPVVISAQIPNFFWSMPGAAGIVDESSASKVIFHDTGSAAIRSSVSSGTVQLRYPIANGPEKFPEDNPSVCLRLSVRDTGASARVLVQLVAIHATTGARIVLTTFDSDERLTTPSDQYRPTGWCDLSHPDGSGPLLGFDHFSYSYHFNVTLIKTNSTGNPGIRHLGLYAAS